MTKAVFAIPGDLATPTGGYAYARRMLELLPREGIATRRIALPGSYPDPSAADLAGTAELMAAAPPVRCSSSTGSPTEPCRPI